MGRGGRGWRGGVGGREKGTRIKACPDLAGVNARGLSHGRRRGGGGGGSFKQAKPCACSVSTLSFCVLCVYFVFCFSLLLSPPPPPPPPPPPLPSTIQNVFVLVSVCETMKCGVATNCCLHTESFVLLLNFRYGENDAEDNIAWNDASWCFRITKYRSIS